MEKPKKRESVSKQGRKAVKSSKGAPSVQTNSDTLVVEDKGSAEKGGSTKGTNLQQSIVKPDEGTDKQNRGTDRTKMVKKTQEDLDKLMNQDDDKEQQKNDDEPVVFYNHKMAMIDKHARMMKKQKTAMKKQLQQ
ncbi:hypothetical protein Tco_0509167 [Tanacetum coccineum]